jgi:uncharacterized phage-like protein YoqJ
MWHLIFCPPDRRKRRQRLIEHADTYVGLIYDGENEARAYVFLMNKYPALEHSLCECDSPCGSARRAADALFAYADLWTS